MIARTCLPAALAAALLAALSAAPSAAQDAAEVAAGKALAEQRCARCHAVGAEGNSRLPIAPVFRTLSKKYPIESLEEALAEGIVTGHPQMPQFQFEPDQITALVAYIESVQAE